MNTQAKDGSGHYSSDLPSVSISSAFSPVQTDKAFKNTTGKKGWKMLRQSPSARNGTNPTAAAAAMHMK